MNTINLRIKKIRKQCKFTQKDIAKLFGMKYDTYSKKEHHGNFTGEELLLLADCLNVDIRLFFYDCIEDSLPLTETSSENCYILDATESDIITIYRNMPKNKQKSFLAYAHYSLNNRRKYK